MTIGNFSEILGNEEDNNLVGSDLDILYGLQGDDTLTTVEGSLPEGEATTILVGGSGDDVYQANDNSTTIFIENGNSDNDVAQITGIGFLRDTSFALQIDNGRHLYVGDTESDQYALFIDWQEPENRIETFEAEDGSASYQDIVDDLGDLGLLDDSLTWEEISVQEEFDLERLGLSSQTMDEDIAIVNTRNAVLEEGNILPENLIEMYRFRNTTHDTGTYLFTAHDERNAILGNTDFNQTFVMEGMTEDHHVNPAFIASLTSQDDEGRDLEPFYRLQSVDVAGTYLYVGQAEYDTIFADGSDQQDKWVKEGLNDDGIDIAEFYLYGVDAGVGVEFHRFQNTQNNGFLYAGPVETAIINNNPDLSDIFQDQGVAFEAFDL
ncbi:MAG: hypothetical protein QNJ70_15105 [Xenococcaceae cyanobacterium MO_207.B15]|nr:hypothetical protein [Xenococcaceae cyanobacterium MO_207.B15]